jgi:preprotein translocase subunit SecE
MSNQSVETVGSKSGYVIVALAVLIAVGGIVGYSFLTEQPTAVRLVVLLGGIALGLGVAWLSQPGKQFIGYARDSYNEARRVVWPTRKETIQTTLIVFAFVAIMSLFLFVTDKALEWALYDLLLKWRS